MESKLPRPSGLPRPASRLPLPKSSIPNLAEAAATGTAATTRPAQLRSISGSFASRTRQPGSAPSSITNTFKKPTATSLRASAKSRAPAVQPIVQQDILTNSHDASAASSRASSRLEYDNSDEAADPPRTPRSRMSLAERTVESISRLPPSGTTRRRRSSFFGDPAHSPAGPGAQEEHDSSHGNSSTESLPPVPKLRLGQPKQQSLGTMRLGTGGGGTTAGAVGNGNGKSLGPAQSRRSVSAMTPRASLAGSSARALSVATPGQTKTSALRSSVNRQPPKATPSKSTLTAPSKSVLSTPTASKPAAARPEAKSRPALGGLPRTLNSKPAAGPKMKAAAPKARPASKNAIGTAKEERSPADPAKSSAALREQIRQARAAKRSLLNPSETEDAAAANENVEPSEPAKSKERKNRTSDPSEFAAFDFGLDSSPSASPKHNAAESKHAATSYPRSNSFDATASDPFNQHPKAGSTAAVLRKRVDQARAEGRLNICGLGLTEIPEAVMKIYDYEYNSKQNSNVVWNEAVDLTKFLAADNELEAIGDHVFPDVDPSALQLEDEGPDMPFGGVEMLDLRGNKMSGVPMGLRRLERLTALNLARNKLTTDVFTILAQIPSLKDLKLNENSLQGALPTEVGRLENLDTLELQDNQITVIGDDTVSGLRHLRVLNVGNNKLTSLATDALSRLPITQLLAFKNSLSGTFLPNPTPSSFTKLQHLDISINTLTRLTPVNDTDGDDASSSPLSLPHLHTLNISFNRITALPSFASFTSLITFLAEDNKLTALPDDLVSLTSTLKILDIQGNEIRTLDARLGKMTALDVLRVGANPMRERKFLGMGVADVKRELRGRLGEGGGEADELD